MRLAALMGLPVLYIFTHDSIGVGEDGPTHQPVEHLAALRAIPDLVVLRPGRRQRSGRGLQGGHAAHAASRRRWCSRGRTSPRWTAASTPRPPATQRGGYVLADAPGGKPQVILIGTGSEVSLCLAAYEQLAAEGHRRPRGQPAQLGTLRRPAGRVSPTRCCRRR